MRNRHLFTVLVSVLLASACTKEEPLYSATLHATCRDCVVSYAAGAAQSKKDTLHGVPDPATGDTMAETGQWTVQLKDGDNLFLRACRLHPDTNLGDLYVWVDGSVQPLEASADSAQDCAEINQIIRGR
ncbi:MAG: hypothetical protein KBH07_07955 [Flavobacteriales bacterium]|nr:hypothetical protein [Flavobacteriales bacterium]MBP9080139.1 hypothetical protein [Flavobacteriales bacterium]